VTARAGATVVKPGQRWRRFDRTARVLGVLEGYVVYRFKGAGVGVMYWRDFEQNFTQASPVASSEVHKP